jgi:hypothetical protein
MSCEDLSAERGRIANALTKACHTQRNARGNDIAGVIMLGIPVGSICGQNMTTDIRRLKGELETVESVAKSKGCNLPEIPDPVKQK